MFQPFYFILFIYLFLARITEQREIVMVITNKNWIELEWSAQYHNT